MILWKSGLRCPWSLSFSVERNTNRELRFTEASVIFFLLETLKSWECFDSLLNHEQSHHFTCTGLIQFSTTLKEGTISSWPPCHPLLPVQGRWWERQQCWDSNVYLFNRGFVSDEETKVGLTLAVQVFITFKCLQSSRATLIPNNAQREHHFCWLIIIFFKLDDKCLNSILLALIRPRGLHFLLANLIYCFTCQNDGLFWF